jgi:hypothetical protein
MPGAFVVVCWLRGGSAGDVIAAVEAENLRSAEFIAVSFHGNQVDAASSPSFQVSGQGSSAVKTVYFLSNAFPRS